MKAGVPFCHEVLEVDDAGRFEACLAAHAPGFADGAGAAFGAVLAVAEFAFPELGAVRQEEGAWPCLPYLGKGAADGGDAAEHVRRQAEPGGFELFKRLPQGLDDVLGPHVGNGDPALGEEGLDGAGKLLGIEPAPGKDAFEVVERPARIG